MAYNAQKDVKDFSNKRFTLRISINDKTSTMTDSETGKPVNDFIICQRYFDTFNYIEGSMHSLEFKHTVDRCITAIEEELKMESRLWLTYNWTGSRPVSFGRTFGDGIIGGKPMPEELKKNGGFYNNNDFLDDDLLKPMAEPWTYTLKLSVFDNERNQNVPVIEAILDVTPFPKEIRENIDLTNDMKGTDTDRLNGVAYIKAIIKKNRENLVSTILNKFYAVCSPNTKETEQEVEYKRIQRMLNEKFLGKSTTARAIYFTERDKRMAKSLEKKENSNTTKA